ncbi:hypothetical protein F441_22349 [Phytophthora nicotianae CJ01A1]|nr:hypothetical protein F441_22349 [Phytophthora nicotianae CJ01A1]
MNAGKTVVFYPFFECSEIERQAMKANGEIQTPKHILRLVFGSENEFILFDEAVHKVEFDSLIDLILLSEDSDKYLYDLCCLLPKRWLDDKQNLWNLARMFYQMPGKNPAIMRRTYAAILRFHHGEWFCEQTSMISYDNDGPNIRYPIQVDIRKLKAIAGGACHKAYQAWKLKYESKSETESETETETETEPTEDETAKIPDKKSKKKPSFILKEKMIEIAKDRYRRQFGTGAIYKKITNYYYKRAFDDPKQFLNEIFINDRMYQMCSQSDHKELLHFIKDIAHPDFLFMKIDYDYMGFKNGVYCLKDATFIVPESVPNGIQVRVYHDFDYNILKETPLLDKFFDYQFDTETTEFIYFMLGRALTKIRDKFDFMVMLVGVGGAGKSLLVNLLSEAYGSAQVGILGSSFQDRFGLCEFANKQIVTSDDMPRNIAKTEIRFSFDADPSDTSGEIIRRILIAHFANSIPDDEKDMLLEDKIMDTEFATFIHRCRSTYLQYCRKYAGQNIYTFCPNHFLESRDMLRGSINESYQFAKAHIKYSEPVEGQEPKIILKSDLTRMFRAYIKEKYSLIKSPKQAMDIQSLINADDRIIPVRITMLSRDDFVKFLSSGKKIAATTLKNRAGFLFKQYRDIGGNADDLSYLNSYSKVIRHINENGSEEVRKTYLFHVVALLNTKAGKVVDAETRQKIIAASIRLRNKSKKQSLHNIATDKQQSNFISIYGMTGQLETYIHKLFADYDMSHKSTKISDDDFVKWNIPSDRKNIKSFARDLQRCMMLACYVYQPALRSDWPTLKITSAAVKRLDDKQNWIQVLRGGRIRLIMNDFKNVKSFGKHTIEVENVHLKRYLRYWINLLERLLGSEPEHLFIYQLSPVKEVKLISTTRHTFGKAISRNSEKIFNKPQSVNSFRHAWEIKFQQDPAYRYMTQAERQALHNKLLHGVFTGQLYNWQRRGFSE